MTASVRTFIAIKVKPQPPLIQLLTNLKEIFEGENIKWVNENNLHLTLKFLGDTSPVQVEQIKSVIRESGEKLPPLCFDLKGVGFFKRNRQPKVLFVNIEKEEILKQLAAEIDAKLFDLGFEKEKREFNPHLTLGRIKFLKNKHLFYKTIDEFKSNFIQQVEINEVIFYQSILKPDGPKYNPIIKVELK